MEGRKARTPGRSPKDRTSFGAACGVVSPGPYQIQAAINAVHADAATAAGTDWRQILLLYDQLWQIAPSPVVALVPNST